MLQRSSFAFIILLIFLQSISFAEEKQTETTQKITTKQLLDPNWLEQRLAKVGIAKLIADYEGHKVPEITIVRDALMLSKVILEKHPEALRSQLQGRLVSYKEEELKLFQILPSKDVQLQLQSPTLIQAGDFDAPLFTDFTSSSLNAVAISPDGKQIVTARRDKLELWDRHSKKLLKVLRKTPSNLFSSHTPVLKFTPDGKKVISNFQARPANVKSFYPQHKVWNSQTGKLEQTIQTEKNSIRDFAMTFDSKQIIAAVNRRELGVWDISTGKLLRKFASRKNNIRRWAISPDDKLVATSQNYKLTVWDLKAEQLLYNLPLKHLRDLNSYITSMEFSPDSQSIFIGGHKGSLKQWEIKKGRELKSFEEHSNRIIRILFPTDGRHVISINLQGKINLWDMKTGEFIRTIYHCPTGMTRLNATSDGEHLLYLTNRGLIVKNLKQLYKKTRRTQRDHAGQIHSVTITPDGKKGISAAMKIVIKNLTTNKVLQSFIAHNGNKINAILCTQDSKQLLTCSNKSLRVWDIETGKLLKKYPVNKNMNALSMAWTKKGKQLWVGGSGNKLVLWDFEKSKKLSTHSLSGISNVYDMHLTSDESKIIIRSTYVFSLFDTKTNIITKKFGRFSSGIYYMTLLPDEKELLYSQGNSKIISRTGLESDEGITISRQFGEHEWFVNDGKVSPDGKHFVSVSADKTLKLWNIKKRKAIATFHFDTSVKRCRFSPDGKAILAGDEIGHVHYLKILNLPQ